MPKMQRAENRRNPQILRGLCPVLAHKANQNMAESEGEMSTEEKNLFELALGRIFRIGSRPAQPNDAREFERCKKIIIGIHERTKKNETRKMP